MFWGRGFGSGPIYKEQSSKLWECGNRVVLRDFQGLREGWEARGWLSMLSTARHFHSYLFSSVAFPPFFCLLMLRRKRYDSVPVSRMCARSVMRSSTALHKRAFGITCVHSENGKLVVMTTACVHNQNFFFGEADQFSIH
jgi:hypothetical protein